MEILTQNKLSSLGVKIIRQWNRLLVSSPPYADYNAIRPLGPRKSACYAPHSSMYIASNGDVRACCMNTNQIFGNLKHSTLSEIWHSEQRKIFRQASDSYNLPAGCRVCLENFENGNASNSTALLYDQYGKHKWPQRIDFELSLACNLDCRMCMFSSHQNQGIKQKAGFHFGEHFRKQLGEFIPYLKLAGFYGGEPFIIPEYFKIWEMIQARNPKTFITVQSNGSILNEQILQHIEKGRFQVNVSIDSLKKDRFEYIRDKAGFEQVIENFEIINRISQKKKITQSIAVCPMRQNLNEMDDLLEFANRHKSLIYFNTVITKGFSLEEIPPEELRDTIQKLSRYKVRQKSPVEKINAARYNSLLGSLSTLLEHNIMQEAKRSQKIRLNGRELITSFTEKLDSRIHNETIQTIEKLPISKDKIFTLNMITIDKINNLSSQKIIDFLRGKPEDRIVHDFYDFLEIEFTEEK